MYKFLLFVCLSLLVFSCSDDDDTSCTGDTLEEVIPGNSWNYNFLGSTGTVQFNEDGTYEDISNTVLEVGGTTESKVWMVTGANLQMDITSDNGNSAGLDLDATSVSCDRIVFDGQGFGDIIFSR